MATLMQKDALLEGVAQALGYADTKGTSKDITILENMQNTIYNSKPEDRRFRF